MAQRRLQKELADLQKEESANSLLFKNDLKCNKRKTFTLYTGLYACMVLQQKMFIFSTSTVVGFRWKNNAHTYFRKRFAQLTYLFSSSRIVNIMQRFDSLTTIL